MTKKKYPHLVPKRKPTSEEVDAAFRKTIPELLKHFDNAETHRKLDELLNSGDADFMWQMHFKIDMYWRLWRQGWRIGES